MAMITFWRGWRWGAIIVFLDVVGRIFLSKLGSKIARLASIGKQMLSNHKWLSPRGFRKRLVGVWTWWNAHKLNYYSKQVQVLDICMYVLYLALSPCYVCTWTLTRTPPLEWLGLWYQFVPGDLIGPSRLYDEMKSGVTNTWRKFVACSDLFDHNLYHVPIDKI